MLGARMDWSLPDSGLRRQHIVFASRDVSVTMLSNFPHLIEDQGILDSRYSAWFFLCVKRKIEWRARIMAADGNVEEYVRRMLDYVRKSEEMCLEQYGYVVRSVRRVATKEEIEKAAQTCADYLLTRDSQHVPTELKLVDCVRDLARMNYAVNRIILPLRQVLLLVPEVLPVDEDEFICDDVTEPDVPADTLLLRAPFQRPQLG